MLPVAMCPDPCLSEDEKTDETVLDKEEVIPSLLKDEETEFDTFLLDAVQWL